MSNQQIELETKIAFLEKYINELSDVVYAQQKNIDNLQRDYKSLKDKFGSLANNEGISDQIEKPPHY